MKVIIEQNERFWYLWCRHNMKTLSTLSVLWEEIRMSQVDFPHINIQYTQNAALIDLMLIKTPWRITEYWYSQWIDRGQVQDTIHMGPFYWYDFS